MTTLKTYHADEIASAMSAQLGDEGFVGLYRKADMAAGSPAFTRFTNELPQTKDAVAGTKLWNETSPDFRTEDPDEMTQAKAMWAQKFPGTPVPGGQKAEDGACCPACGKEKCECQKAEDGCPKHPEARDGCPECADAAGLAVAIDFAIRHVVKVADALDKVGFVGVAGALDETLQKLAANRPFVVRAARSYKEWVSFLKKKSPKAADKFKKSYKGALEHAKKEKGLGAEKAEAYAMRTALDGVPKSYLKEPTPEHGKGKSGPLTAKR